MAWYKKKILENIRLKGWVLGFFVFLAIILLTSLFEIIDNETFAWETINPIGEPTLGRGALGILVTIILTCMGINVEKLSKGFKNIIIFPVFAIIFWVISILNSILSLLYNIFGYVLYIIPSILLSSLLVVLYCLTHYQIVKLISTRGCGKKESEKSHTENDI